MATDCMEGSDYTPIDPGQIVVCECGVIVLLFGFGDGFPTRWDPTFFQRRWVRSLWPAGMVDPHGYGWGVGMPHVCCAAGYRPVDVIARMHAEKGTGMGLAGDGSDEGPKGGAS